MQIVMTQFGAPATVRARQLEAIKARLGDDAAIVDERLYIYGVDVSDELDPEYVAEDQVLEDVVVRAVLRAGGDP